MARTPPVMLLPSRNMPENTPRACRLVPLPRRVRETDGGYWRVPGDVAERGLNYVVLDRTTFYAGEGGLPTSLKNASCSPLVSL